MGIKSGRSIRWYLGMLKLYRAASPVVSQSVSQWPFSLSEWTRLETSTSFSGHYTLIHMNLSSYVERCRSDIQKVMVGLTCGKYIMYNNKIRLENFPLLTSLNLDALLWSHPQRTINVNCTQWWRGMRGHYWCLTFWQSIKSRDRPISLIIAAIKFRLVYSFMPLQFFLPKKTVITIASS